MKLNKFTKLKILEMMVILLLMFTAVSISAAETVKKYTISKIHFTGNTRVSEKKVRELISVTEGMSVSEDELEFLMKVSRSKMEAANLFMFIDMNLETHDEGNADLYISMGENVIFLDMVGLEQGGLTRFSSISEKAPDFGFMVGSKSQALYFRFPYLFQSPLNLATTMTHYAYEIPFNQQNRYDYEAASARAALDMVILPNWKIKIPAVMRYNIKGNAETKDTGDFSTGFETMLDFSHYKNVIYTGFDINAGIYQGIANLRHTQPTGGWQGDQPQGGGSLVTLACAGLNLYIKPFKWEELVFRGRYNSILNGNVPDYVLYRIDNEYQVRGYISRHYYGRNSLVFNAENWLHNIVTIPAAITNINFSLLAFVDLGTAANTLGAIGKDTWNLTTGGAMVIDFTTPINISLQAGYGQELWQNMRQNTGGQFYVKMGYEFRKGDFFE